MSQTKHLLETVAKSSGKDLTGYQWVDTPFYTGFQCRNIDPEHGFEEEVQDWNPLEDNGDALILAAETEMDISFGKIAITITRGFSIDKYSCADGMGYMASVREAIVSTAVKIGESTCQN